MEGLERFCTERSRGQPASHARCTTAAKDELRRYGDEPERTIERKRIRRGVELNSLGRRIGGPDVRASLLPQLTPNILTQPTGVNEQHAQNRWLGHEYEAHQFGTGKGACREGRCCETGTKLGWRGLEQEDFASGRLPVLSSKLGEAVLNQG